MELHADARFAIAHTEDGGIQVNRASRIMTAGTHAAYLSANELLAHARGLADDMTTRAHTGYEEACERGYEAGLAKARQQAIHDQVRESRKRQDSLENLQADLNALVLQTVRQLLGEMDCTERVGMLIREGLTRLGKLQGEISIHVHPELLDRISAGIGQWPMAQSDIRLKTIANPEISLEACRIVSQSGRVDGDLRPQLEALESALSMHRSASAPTSESEERRQPC
ncbi:MAG TPA: type III secretion system stator protein SctL [Herbaspirillum sp.]